jgi:hypothetical protein
MFDCPKQSFNHTELSCVSDPDLIERNMHQVEVVVRFFQ